MRETLSHSQVPVVQAVIMVMMSLSLVFSATIKTGPAEVIYGNINTTNFGYDMAASTVKINATELYFWIENGEYTFKKFSFFFLNHIS